MQQIIRVGEDKSPLATGEQRREDRLELSGDILKSAGEYLENALVDLLDHGEQIPPGCLEILQLGRQELVALFQRREFLQCERIHSAQ